MQKLIKRQYSKFNLEDQKVFGRLTLTGQSCVKTINGKYVRFVTAECECGVIRDYKMYLLLRGETRSCGCYRKDVARDRMTTHGLSKHPLFEVWQAIRRRCAVPEYQDFPNYGGRGIAICDEWFNDFQPFYDWCMANGWVKGWDIDRRNNDGHYEPDNCRFVQRPESNRNTRRNRYYTAFGETKCLFDWGNDPRCVIGVWGLRNRMDRGKWDENNFESALTTPLMDQEGRKQLQRNNKNTKQFTAWGETKCMTAWLEDSRCLVKIDSFRDRLAKGWDVERVMSTPPTKTGFAKIN